MKLLYIITNISGAGGLERILLLKADYLITHYGYNIDILITNPVDLPIYYKVNEQINLHFIKPVNETILGYFRSYSSLINKSIMEINPDIVVMCDNGLKSFLLPFIIKKRKPLIYERHITKYKKEKFEKSSFLNTIKDRVKSIYMDFCAARYDKFITVIPEGAAEWKGNNIEVIPNPLWLVIDKSSELKNKRIISIGRHAYEKGYDRLFEVWKQVLSKYPDWQLDIYGDKNNDYDIEKIAIESGLTKGVNFYEPVLDIESVYLDASIYLMTSRYEGFGMVLLEAMACGVPCVAFDCPVGPKNIISDAEDGFLIPDDNMDLFISRVEELIKNEELRVNMGRNSKVNVKKFTLEPIMKRWDDLFKSLIENHKEHR